jgi:L-ascorbate metabolism protein UlaG (beta-lactamase superfamily)
MKITKYAQSTVAIEHEGKKVLIDPGNYNFEPGRLSREDFKDVDALIVTHKHADHFDLDAVKAIYAQSKPAILTTKELAEVMTTAGVPASLLTVGQVIEIAGFRIEGVRADHVVRGEVIDVFGIVVDADKKRVYHTSDTTYFDDKPSDVDIVFVPINNRGVAMDFDDAARFVRELSPRIAVPVHYDSPKDSHINPNDWAKLLADSKIEVRVMAFGEQLQI